MWLLDVSERPSEEAGRVAQLSDAEPFCNLQKEGQMQPSGELQHHTVPYLSGFQYLLIFVFSKGPGIDPTWIQRAHCKQNILKQYSICRVSLSSDLQQHENHQVEHGLVTLYTIHLGVDKLPAFAAYQRF